MKTQNSKYGFSLIELSIVILVIGILVIGITKGSRIISAAKIKSALSLTINSPVSSTEGLIFWLDTVRENSLRNSNSSFNISEADDIKDWYSVNPQYNNSIVATQSTTAAQPQYTEDGINGLPSLVFDGSADYLEIADSADVSPTSGITIFVVAKFNSTLLPNGVQGIISKDVSSGITNPPYFIALSSTGPSVKFGTTDKSGSGGASSDPSFPATDKTYIFCGYYLNGYPYLMTNNVMGTASTLSSGIVDSSGVLMIGQQKSGTNRFFNGMMSEIIMFNRALKTSEISAINNYLSNKYQVKFN